MEGIGRLLIILGIILLGFGLLFVFINKIPFLGKLPGDIYIQKKNFIFYFPLATCLLVSFILSIFLWLFLKR